MSASQRKCQECGKDLPGQPREEFCAECLFDQALTGVSGEEEPPPEPQFKNQSSNPDPGKFESFGDYELLERVGHGGMGMVYRARQRSLNRVVAVKTMAFGLGLSPELVKRFHSEAVAVAALRHPNIVAIHEVGVSEGRHFLVMDYVDGQSLADLVRGGPMPENQAARYLKTVAEAVHYAHERGILHRDLKPSNILIDREDQPRVVDFGLAKKLNDAAQANSDSALTVTGQVLGSPNYAPPEQAAAGHAQLSRSADVYALGATLYHLLTGRPPFQAESIAHILSLVAHAEPLQPRLLNPEVPRELETICLKCLEKEPSRRYATAQALAEELGRYLRGEPILAQPAGLSGRAWRWCRRNPMLAAAGGATFLSLLVGLAGVLWQWQRAEVQRLRAETGEVHALRQAYAADMVEVQRSLDENDLGRARELLSRHAKGTGAENPGKTASVDLRSWEWRYLWARCRGNQSAVLDQCSNAVSALAFSPDSKLVAVEATDGLVFVVDVQSGRRWAEFPHQPVGWFAKALAFSPANHLAWSSRSATGPPVLKITDLKSRAREIRELPQSAYVRSVAFSPDGKEMATLADDGMVWVRDAASFQLLRTFVTADSGASQQLVGAPVGRDRRLAPLLPGRTNHSFSPEGERYSTSRLWSQHYGCVLYSPDNRWLAIGEMDRRIRLFDRKFGTEAKPIELTAPADGITALAFSPQSKYLAAGGGAADHQVHVWNLIDGSEMRLSGHNGWISALAFSEDGHTLASTSADQTLRLWFIRDGTERSLQGHLDEAWAMAWSPVDKQLVTGGRDGTVLCWDPAAERMGAYRKLSRQIHFWGPTFLPDSRSFLALTRPEGRVVRWEIARLQILEELNELGGNHTSIELSRDGRWLALGDLQGNVQVWNYPARTLVTNLVVPGGKVFALIFSPRSTTLACGAVSPRGTLAKVWSVTGWREVRFDGLDSQALVHADFSPDDRMLSIGYVQGKAAWFDIATGKRVADFDCASSSAVQVAFSRTGQFATGNYEGRLTIWDRATRKSHPIGRGYKNTLHQVIFSPDGRRVVASGTSPKAVVKIWDVETGRDVATLPGEAGWYSRIGFSPDGNTLFAASQEGTALFWQAPSLEEVEASKSRSTTHLPQE